MEVTSHLFLLLLSSLFLSVVVPLSEGRAVPPSYGSSINFNGRERFALGVNYPWLNYGGDFGENAWGSNGVAEKYATHQAAFQDMSSKQVQVVRWWVFSDLRAGVTFDSQHNPTGIDSKVFGDLDAAIAIASSTNTFLLLSLFDFYMLQWPSSSGGVTLGGCTDLITDAGKLEALINNVVVPVLQRYANEPNIFAWEIMNEPEWIISDLPQPSVNTTKVNPVTIAQFYQFASKISDAVHQYTDSYVTVGSACLKWYRIWTPAFAAQMDLPSLELDFYQAHYYSWMDGGYVNTDPELGPYHQFSPLVQDYKTLADVDRPIVVAEFSIPGTPTGNLIEGIIANGYAGALPWAYFGGSEFAIDWTSYDEVANRYKNITG